MKVFSVLLALSLCCGCSQQGRLLGAAAGEMPQPALIEVVFNHRSKGRYQSPLTGQWRNGDDL